MERKKVQPTFVWNKKRATSMLLLGLSILLLVYVVNIVVKLVYLNNEANELRETLQSMIDENHKTQGDEIIDVYVRCITPGTDEDYQLDIENIKQRYQSTMNKGTDSLKKAKVCHDEIEKLYVANIEYEKLNQIGDRLIWMIDEQKV